MNIDASASVRDVALAVPGAPRVFERLHIDYCCGGETSLAAACARAGVPLPRLLTLLQEEAARDDRPPPDASWDARPLDALVDFVEQTHHAFARSEMGRLGPLAAKVRQAHGDAHPEVQRVALLLDALRGELEPHMRKEEMVLFPLLRELAVAGDDAAATAVDIGAPIHVMQRDHDAMGEVLADLRETTHGYATPGDACASFRALYEGLEALERDLHRHVHLENNVLFPRALAILEP